MKTTSLVVALAALLLPLGCSSPPKAAAKKRAHAKPPAASLAVELPEAQGKTVLAQWLERRANGPTPAGYDPDGVARREQPDARPETRARRSEPAPAGTSIVGLYECDLPSNAGSSRDPMASMAEGFAKMLAGSVDLEMRRDSTFRMSVMGMGVDGKYEVDGRNVELVADTFMGLTPQEAKRLAQSKKGASGDLKSFDQFREPLVGTISADFSRMTLRAEGHPKEQMTFRRKHVIPPGRPTVSALERKLVGEWRVTPETMRSASADASTPEERRAAEAVIGGFALSLRRDNTFTMRIMMPLDGRWKADATTITLTPTGFMGMSLKQKGVKTNMNEPMVGRVAPDLSQIRFADPKGKGPALAFGRASDP